MLSLADFSPSRPGAVVFVPGQRVSVLLADFAAELQARGFRVGGLIQRDMTLVALDTGESLSIEQNLGPGAESCSVDPAAVSQSTEALRRAIRERPDLVIVNKFSHLEVEGGGLADETLAAIAEGLPVLVAVPAEHLGTWLEVTGGQCDLLTADRQSLWRWWGPQRLYVDLLAGVEDAPVRRVVVGPKFVMVEGPHGVGLAANLCDTSHAPTTGSLRQLATGVLSWDVAAATVGIAAINAHYNRFELDAPQGDGLAAFPEAEGRIVVVGAFPGVAERRPNVAVVDLDPSPGQYPAAAAGWLLPGAGAALITAASLANRTLPGLLEKCADLPTALVGPGTPLTPRLFDHGLDLLAGLVVTDADGLAAAVQNGACGKQFKAFGRSALLRRPD